MTYQEEKRLLHGGDYNPDQWLAYPDILAQDIALMQASKVNTVSVGIFAWSALEPREGEFHFDWLDKIFDDVDKMGGNVILATPSGARPAWLSAAYPEVLRTTEKQEKLAHGGRHNHCFSSPIYRKKVAIINRKLAERYGQHPALYMWHISNEYGGDCHCAYCQENFRSWLKDKYGTLAALNAAWWGTFWSHTYTDWTQISSPSSLGETMVHGMNLDWKRFVTDQTIDFYEHEIKEIRVLTPNVPITTNFMGDGDDLIPFQSLDYGKFAEHVDVISWDCYPAWHNDWGSTADLAAKVGFINDQYRALKQQPFLIMESTPSLVNWHPVNKAKRPGMHLLSSMQFLAHGSDSVMYFQWRKSRGSSEKFHGAVVDHDGCTENRVFKDVTAVGDALDKLTNLKGSNKTARAAIIYDWDNDWALADAQGFSDASKRYPQTLQDHYRFFWNHDIPVDVITSDQALAKYDLVIAPMLYLIRQETMAKLTDFVAKGGHLVSSYMTGYVDENDLAYLGGWPKPLQSLFGINVTETDTLYPKDRNGLLAAGQVFEVTDYCSLFEVKTAKTLATYTADFYQNQAAVVANLYGQGQAYYMGARTGYDYLAAFYTDLVETLGLTNQWVVLSDPDVSVQSRQSDEITYHFVMNFSETDKTITVCEPTVDLLTGQAISKEIKLSPYQVSVLTSRD